MTAPTPADVAARPEPFFAPYRPAAHSEGVAQRRSRSRDVLHREIECLGRAVAATRGRDDDVDLTLELLDRQIERFLLALRDFDEAINAGPVPSPTSRRIPRLAPGGDAS